MTAECPYRYRLFGWRVASAIALPELAPCSDDDASDVTIALGAAPALEHPLLKTPLAQVDANGCAYYAVPGIAAYRIERGTRVTIQPARGADESAVRLFLLGSVLALLCQQRQLLPLAAATVEIHGQAVALAGPGASGRSTLAAAFWRKGHRILSDDVSAVAIEADAALALPGPQRIGLWADIVEELGWSERPHTPCRDGLAKQSFVMPEAFAGPPLPLVAILYLERHTPGTGGLMFRRLRGQSATTAAYRHILRGRAFHTLLGRPASVARTAQLAGRVPRHFALRRPLRFEDLDTQVDMIVETVRSAQ